MNKPKITLCMIVKNEAHIILECLNSVIPYIDSYCIVDTGSTDNTEQIIVDYFSQHQIPGSLYSRPWINFGENRTEALELSRSLSGDYILMMDADDTLCGEPDFSNLDADGYYINIKLENITYPRVQLFSTKKPWIYCGVVHEYPECYEPFTLGKISNSCWINARCEGSRSKDPDKFKKDIELLQHDLTLNPSNTRSAFYLAQSQFDDGQFENAYKSYHYRVSLGEWEEEVFYSLFRMGLCLMYLNKPDSEITWAMLNAWSYRPSRIEPLYYLARWYRERNNFQIASIFARQAFETPIPETDVLFIESDIYDWKIKDEYSLILFYTGHKAESLEMIRSFIQNPAVPSYHMDRLIDNYNKILKSIDNT